MRFRSIAMIIAATTALTAIAGCGGSSTQSTQSAQSSNSAATETAEETGDGSLSPFSENSEGTGDGSLSPFSENSEKGDREPSPVSSVSYTEKEVPIFKEAETDETASLRFYEDLPNVAYISITDYYHLFLPDKEMTVEEVGADTDVYQVVSATGSATVDAAEETISSDDMAAFTNLMTLMQEDMDNVYCDGAPYVRVAGTQYTPEKNPVTYDLSDYQIDVRADDEGLYLPIATLNDMYTDLISHAAFYDGAKIFVEDTYDSKRFYQIDPDYGENHFTALERPADLADFTYRELCFAIDHFYGLPGRCLLNDAVAEKGLDRALTEYGPAGVETKRLLESTDMGEYLAGLNFLNGFFYDGGHTLIVSSGLGESVMSDELMARYTEVRNEHSELEEMYQSAILDFISLYEQNRAKKVLRDAAYGENVNYVKKGDTAVCVFDSFNTTDIKAMSDYLAGKTTELPLDGGDPFAGFLDALRQASEDPEVRNFVIDISNNLGGSADLVAAMTSLILGDEGSKITFDSILTGQKGSESFTVDRNFNGRFDEEDKDVHYDLRFGFVVSKESFSCGNLVTSIMKDNGILVMGEKTRGGACAVQTMATADGLVYWISSARYRLTDKAGNNIDGGIEPDVDLVVKNEDGSDRKVDVEIDSLRVIGIGSETDTKTIELNDYSEFYNIDRLSEEMNAFYE